MFRTLISNCSKLSCNKSTNSSEETNKNEIIINHDEQQALNYKEIFQIQSMISEEKIMTNRSDDLFESKENLNEQNQIVPTQIDTNLLYDKKSIETDTDSSNDNFYLDMANRHIKPIINQNSDNSYLTEWDFIIKNLKPEYKNDTYIELDDYFLRRKRLYDYVAQEILQPRINNSDIKFLKKNKQIEGGYGCVRKGRIKKLYFKTKLNITYFKLTKQYVAAKCIDRNYLHCNFTLKTFINEVAILQNCDHENILKYIGIVYGKQNFYMITEWCDGFDLYGFLHEQNQLWNDTNIRDIIKLCLDIAKGIDYLHSEEIIHRDLKSPNILLFRDNYKYKAKIADFGFAYSLKYGFINFNCSSFSINMHVGTAKWMAPEIQSPDFDKKIYKSNIERYSAKSDVYSFGIVLYEMMSQEIPFEKMDQRLVNNLMRVGRLNLMECDIRDDSPDDLVNLMWDCTLFEKELRPNFKNIRVRIENIINSIDNDNQGKTFFNKKTVRREN